MTVDELLDEVANPKPHVYQPSKAVVANWDSSRNGIVLWFSVDSLIASEIEQLSRGLDDLGLDDAPNGISIWEGTYVWFPGGYECPQDGTSEARGTFRAPTDEEWTAIREGRSPWP